MPVTLINPPAPLTGIVEMYAGSSIPAGYLSCNGAVVSRTTYAALFAVIGTTFGAGDGSTTFGLPDFNNAIRFPIGFTSPGVAGGNINALSNHNHDLQNHNHNHSHAPTTGQFITTGTPNTSITATATNYHLTSTTTNDATGPSPNNTSTNGTGTDTRPPFLSLIFIIKT